MKKLRILLAPLRAAILLHKLALILVAALVLLYALAGFLLVPYLGRRQLEAYATDTLKRPVAIGALSFNPFTFAAEVGNVRLSERDGSLMLGFEALRVNAGLVCSALRRAICLQEVHLDSPAVELVIGRDGSLNLAALAPPSKREPAPPESDEPPRVYIERLAVDDGRVGFLDQNRPHSTRAQLGPIEFTVQDFQTVIGHQNPYSFAALSPLGEALRWSGQFTLRPFGSTGSFAVSQLKLATLDTYLAEYLPFALATGEVSLSGSYRFVLDPLELELALPTLAARNVDLAEPADRANAPVHLSSMSLKDTTFSLQKRDLGMRVAALSGLRVEAFRAADGSFNLQRLFTPKPAPARAHALPAKPQDATPSSARTGEQEQAPGSGKTMRVHIDSFHLADSRISAEDRGVLPSVKLELAPVTVSVQGWSSQPETKFDFETDITINQQGRLQTRGDLRLRPVEARVDVNLRDLPLPFLQPYIAQGTAMNLQSGALQLQGGVHYGPATTSAHPLRFNGDLELSELRTVDDFNKQDFIRWSSLAVNGIELGLDPNRLSIAQVVIKKPFANVLIASDTSLNIRRVVNKDMTPLPPKSEKDDDEEKEESSKSEKPQLAEASSEAKGVPFPTRIRRVRIVDGTANFSDQSVRPPFSTRIVGLNGRIAGLSATPGKLADVKLVGKVDRYAPVDITGKVNLLAAAKYTDLSLSFRNMELTTFNPYSDKFAGYNISRGKLSTGLSYKVQDRKLEAQHHVVVDNLEFGTKTDSKEAAPIPVRLAVALLRDRHGVIDLELPVAGTLDDPDFKLRRLVWQVLRKVLVNVVTKPFAAIGKLAGGGEELAYVDFPSGSAELAPTENEKLTKLAKALVERPELKLDVPKTVATKADSEAIARQNYAANVRAPALTPGADGATKARRLAALEASYQNLFKRAPVYPAQTKTDKGVNIDARIAFLDRALLEKLKPDQAALDAIATRRARAVQHALLSSNAELNPERVFITADRDDSKAASGTVRMEMKLE